MGEFEMTTGFDLSFLREFTKKGTPEESVPSQNTTATTDTSDRRSDSSENDNKEKYRVHCHLPGSRQTALPCALFRRNIIFDKYRAPHVISTAETAAAPQRQTLVFRYPTADRCHLFYGGFCMTPMALSGLKVLEFGEFVSAPYCGRLLAGLGADVIKIEKPGAGDSARQWGPFPQDIPNPEKSGLYLFLNMSKKSITLDVETAAGKKIFKDLVKQTNVLVEANSRKKMKRLGFDYKSLIAVNPSLIMTSITAFGQTGPFRDYRACDLINTHMSGMAFGNPAEGVDDPETQPPLKQPAHTGDFMIGLTSGVATMEAVVGQKRGGPGQHVDISAQEALASVGRQELAFWVGAHMPVTRQKGRKQRGGILYPSSDGWVCIWAGPFMNKLIKMIGDPDWAKTDLFLDNDLRMQHMDEFNALIGAWTSEHTSAQIEQAGIDFGVPCSPVRTPLDVVSDPQLDFRKFFVELDHPVAGTLKYPGAPYKFSASPWTARSAAPLLGQHNREIYGDMLGYSKEDLLRLERDGVI
jgi:crotonobetainyl-CoA:carnitine CoA-transferase CaiB-like acyl-CoA transferase